MQILLSLTLSGSALTLLLLALRYLILKKMPSTVYYYAWLLVLLRFILPLPGLVPTELRENPAPAAVVTPLPRQEQMETTVNIPPTGGFVPLMNPAAPQPEPQEMGNNAAQSVTAKKNYVNLKSPELWLTVWAVGAGISLMATVISYKLFTVRVRRSLSPATIEDRRVYRMLPGRKPRLCRCAAFRTPLMFGVFRPLITLPEREYDEELLTNILRHELLHYRRRDTLYKWFTVAVLSTQWFNPLSYLIRREINRACELSCDELLLRNMNREDKLSYGNTLLSMAASATLPAGVVATTFSTEKRNLKERLEQIMKYKRSGARLFAAVLTLALILSCGAAAGPRASAADNAGSTVKISNVDEFLSVIAPDTTIELAPGTYDLSAASDYGQDTHSSYYSWNETYDGFELNLHNVQNLTIRGAGKESTVLAAVPRYANVLKISNCRNVALENLTAGHTTEPGWCMGGVLLFEMTDNARIENCGLYGCGTIGVQARECNGITVKSTEIYECSYGAVSVGSCRDVTVEDCDIHDHGTRAGQGDAMFLFDVNYSEGVTIHKNRIHDNRAQVMLNSDYARRVLFLSNELRGSAYATGVFDLEGYGITVDGCVFEGNDVRGGWYSGSGGVYAANVSGETLEAALFGDMTLRDIDPDDVLPPVPPSGALDLPAGGEVTVTTVDEFLEALGPDRTIILDGTLFDLSAASNYGGIGTDCYYWAEDYDGPELVIHDVNGLTIYAKDTSSGATTLSAIPRYADVLSFRNCENLTLGGFTAGHTKEPGSCSGGVLNLQNCSQVTLEKMRLYGCGVLGIQAFQCATLNILRTEIYECSQGGADFFQCDGIRFADCGIHDVPSPALRFNESGDKTWNGEPIVGLDGKYDVDENGALAACAPPEAVGYAMAAVQAEYDFVRAMQESIVNGDWETLAAHSAYPLTVIFPGERDRAFAHIPDAESLLALDLDKILDEDYRRYVLNAGMGDFYLTIWGYKALDDALCFTYQEGELKVSALLLTASRVAGDQRGLETLTPYLTSPGIPENPFDYEQPTSFVEGSPQLTFAREVQRLFTNHDWVKLSAKISYPLQVFSANTNYVIDNPTDFLAMVHELLFTPAFYRLIENAELDSYGHSIFGSTFCAHRLAMAVVSDTLSSADDLRLSCISVDGPLYQYKEGLSVPPTPMPTLRVMFYETEIKTDCTLWPTDPIELNARISPEIAAGAEFEWKTDNPSVLRAEKTGPDTANITCIDDGTLPQTCKLTVSCGDMAREITVYCRK